MAKTLIISANYPLPENNGSRMRTMNFVRYFQHYGDVDILCPQTGNYRTVPDGPFRKEYLIDYPDGTENKTGWLRRVFDKFVHGKTWATSRFTSDIERYTRKIIINGDYDFILCRYITQAYPLLCLNKSYKEKIILDIDDVMTDSSYEVNADHLSGISKVAKAIDRYILASYYKRCMSFGSLLFCSDTDKSKITDTDTKVKAYVVPNVSPEIKLPPDYRNDAYCNVNKLLFVGSLRYEPNTHGITWFIQRVLPLLQEKFKDIELSVVGRNPPDELIHLTRQHSCIELQADPPEIVPYYNKCGVVIVPLFAGGGTRIKILESGFANRPVISTEIGAYGLGLTAGKNVLVFDDADSFVDKYKQIREDEVVYASLVSSLYDFVSDNYSFDNFSHSLDAVVNKDVC